MAADGVSSTSDITGTGLKKCIPITRAPRSAAAPSVAIGIDDVFDASTTSGRVMAPSRSKIRAFRVGILGRGLDHQVDRGERIEFGRGLDPAQGGHVLVVGELAARHR